MKRLLDESTDELTRSLLEAGVEHSPPQDNKRQLIIALGAGGALGLFSSNAFAWLGTTAGKVTAAGVAVGVAGAVFVAGPMLRPADDGAEKRVATAERARAQEPAAESSVSDGAAGSGSAASREPSSSGAASPSLQAALDVPSSEPSEGTPPGADVGEPSGVEATPAAPAASPRGASERRVARHGSSSKASGSRHGKKSSARRARQMAGVERVKGVDEGAASSVSSPETPDARRAALDAEVRRVDDMHAAARRDDRVALARLVAAYHAEFPDGQLKKEVADFEARLERSDTP